MNHSGTVYRDLESLRGERISVAPAPDWVERSKVRGANRQDGAPVTCLLSERRIHVPENGSYTRLVRRLETPVAVQQLSRVEIPFDPQTQRVTVHAVAIFRGGVLTNHARIGDFELLRREARMEDGIMNGEVSSVLLLKDVRTGDILDVEFTVTNDRGIFSGKSWLIETIAGVQPVGDWKVSWVDSPDRAPAIRGESEALTRVERDSGAWLTREWTASDIRGEEPEPALPGDVLPFDMLQVSSFGGWDEIVTPLLEKWDFEPAERSALDLELAVIRGRAGEDPAKLLEEAVAVARGAVRYQNYSPGILSIVPENLTVIWERRYGDCKEKTLLLSWLLRELGIEADPVLVGTGLRAGVRMFLPCPGVFDHVVTRARLGGKELWIDPTDLYRGGSPATWTSLPFGAGLPLVAGSHDLVTIPGEPAGKTFLHVKERIKLVSESKEALVTADFLFGGGRADWIRGSIDSGGISGLQKLLKSFMESTRRGIEFESDPVVEDDIAANRTTIRVTARIADALQRDTRSGRDVIGLAPFAFAGLILNPDGRKRTQPLALVFPEQVEHEIHVDHPAMTKADYPRGTARHHGFEFDCGSRMERNVPVFWFKYQTLADRVRPADLREYKEAAERAFKALDLMLTLPASTKARFQAIDPQRRWRR